MWVINRMNNISTRVSNYKSSKKQELAFYSCNVWIRDKNQIVQEPVKVVKISNHEEYHMFCDNYHISVVPEHIKRINRGSKMYALCESERLISCGWVAYKELFWIAEIDTVIDMSDSCTGVLYDFETSESFRGKGFYSVLLKYIMSDLIGIDEYLIYAKKENRSSCRGIEKANFTFDGYFKQNASEFIYYLEEKEIKILGHRYACGGLRYTRIMQ